MDVPLHDWAVWSIIELHYVLQCMSAIQIVKHYMEGVVEHFLCNVIQVPLISCKHKCHCNSVAEATYSTTMMVTINNTGHIHISCSTTASLWTSSPKGVAEGLQHTTTANIIRMGPHIEPNTAVSLATCIASNEHTASYLVHLACTSKVARKECILHMAAKNLKSMDGFRWWWTVKKSMMVVASWARQRCYYL
jgi:hypothetical protein